MSRPRPSSDELRVSLFRELSRGHAAELAPILAEIDLLVEPPAHLDAAILAAVPDVAGTAEPPQRVDRAVLAASEAAVRTPARGVVIPFRRRRVLAYASGGALAVAAAAALIVGLRARNDEGTSIADDTVAIPENELRRAAEQLAADRATKVDDEPASAPTAGNDLSSPDDELRRAAERLAADAAAKLGEESAARVRASLVFEPADEAHPTAAHADRWTSDEDGRFARELLAFAERVGDQQPELSSQLEVMLGRERGHCREGGLCNGLLSLRLGELALEGGRGKDAARYASDAARANNEEIRSRARELAQKAAAEHVEQNEE